MTTSTTTTPGSASSTPRQEPFCWCSKLMLRKIREQIEDYSTALGTYLALTVVASDLERDEFQTTHAWLAQLSGLSDRTVRSRLKDLERIEVISVDTPKLKAPSTYKLLSFGNGYRTLGNGCRTFGNIEATSFSGIRSSEDQKWGAASTSKPLGTADRIALENRLKAKRTKADRLADELCDPFEAQSRPADVATLKRLRGDVAELERQLDYD